LLILNGEVSNLDESIFRRTNKRAPTNAATVDHGDVADPRWYKANAAIEISGGLAVGNQSRWHIRDSVNWIAVLITRYK